MCNQILRLSPRILRENRTTPALRAARRVEPTTASYAASSPHRTPAAYRRARGSGTPTGSPGPIFAKMQTAKSVSIWWARDCSNLQPDGCELSRRLVRIYARVYEGSARSAVSVCPVGALPSTCEPKNRGSRGRVRHLPPNLQSPQMMHKKVMSFFPALFIDQTP